MLLIDLDPGEKFKFNNDIWTKLRCVSKYNNDYGRERRIFDCMSSEGRHRPFNDNTEIEPCQMRLNIGGDICD